MDLGAGATWPRVGHLPEVVLVSEAVDPLGRNPGNLGPQPCRLVVGVMHRHEQAIRLESHLFRQKLPPEPNGVALEVVAEGEVPQHFEKGVMTGRSAHFFEVVVFTPGADALLRCHRTVKGQFLDSQKGSLELDHSGVGEEERWVAGRDQRRTRTDRMPTRLKIFQEPAADFSGFHRFRAWGYRRGS